MKEAPTEGSFTLNSMGEQGITGGDDFLLKMSFSGQSLEKHSVPETHVQAQSGRYFFLISIHRSLRTVQWVRIPHILWEATPEGEWRSMEKQEDGRDSLICILLGIFHKCWELGKHVISGRVRFRVLGPQLRVPWKVQSESITDQQCLS